MEISNLKVDRIIIHQIYQRDPEGNKISPFKSSEYTKFDIAAMEEFKSRVVEALGSGSKAVQMEIVEQDNDKLSSIVDRAILEDDKEFIESSYTIAKRLTDAQKTKSIPGGILVVFSGKYGYPEKNFLGIIKADVHSAYEKMVDYNTQEISLKFVEEVLLTPSSRLYKTAGFFEKPNDCSDNDLNKKWTVLISDTQISQTDGKAAAMYFYSDFLGCGYPQTSARTTMQFYKATSSFISSMDITPEKKSDLLTALITYIKVDTSSSITPSEFSKRYFDIDTQDDFKNFLTDQGLPEVSFTKDTTHIESKLKLRKISFSKNVRITAPPDVLKDFVVIESIDGDLDEVGTPERWTKIIVKDEITTQQ